MVTELILLGTAGGPAPVSGRAGIASAIRVDGRVFLVDAGRGTPSRFVDEGFDFAALEAVFITHLHADHTADLPGVLLYPWGLRKGDDGPLPPLGVFGPAAPATVPAAHEAEATGGFERVALVSPDRPVPGIVELVGHILDGWAYHLNVMPLDSVMPDPAQLVRTTAAPPAPLPVVVYDVDGVRVTAVEVLHGHAHPALAYRFDTPDGSIVFSGDTRVSDALVALAEGADVLVHEVVDLDFLEKHGTTGLALERMHALHTDVTEIGAVARRAGAGTLVLTHYLPADPTAVSITYWRERAAAGFTGKTVAGEDGFRMCIPS
ncbi:MBL fold metallo-hydrolase [Microbacterium pygmaeum]|uniref:Ribonuclease BN, tRNA processing enzyme n=1 Tax=Microbacterium pygmaeum TaxID=370764 RepID=A0A1G8APU4_9MICO|nr:MBL fold metallo-hydrolase [Microbacterium pygmaeum]SDH23031.1 Ribonuclease BN, tRNA processing enzyme [Microbacterium pygmaeum]